MTPAELSTSLHSLGWSKTELSRRLGIAPNSVSRWSSGKHPIPSWAVAYIRLALIVKELSSSVAPS